jgi:hypothetical protein
MDETGGNPLPREGERVQATVTEVHPWGLMVRVDGYEQWGASIDTIRRGYEPAVAALRAEAPAVGTSLRMVVAQIRRRDHAPQVWLDMTLP